MQVGIGRNRDSGLIAGYRRLLDVRSAKNIYRRRSWVYDTVGHAPLAIDRLLDVRTTKWQKQLPTTIQCRSHSRQLTSECLFVTACSMDEYAIRREENRQEFNGTQWYICKPKQLIIKVCGWHFVLKLYRHEASRGLFATAELLVLMQLSYMLEWLCASEVYGWWSERVKLWVRPTIIWNEVLYVALKSLQLDKQFWRSQISTLGAKLYNTFVLLILL